MGTVRAEYPLTFVLLWFNLSAVAQPQRSEGEFARLLPVPADCQKAREFERERRRDCNAVLRCVHTLSSQVAAGVQYLNNNPALHEALRNQDRLANPRGYDLPGPFGSFTIDGRLRTMANGLQELARTTPSEFRPSPARVPGSAWPPEMHCAVTWEQVSTRSLPAFESYSTTGQALIASARNEYRPVEVENGELIAFNDRYTGVEGLERAYAAYRQAFRDDDIAGMFRERPAMLQGLQQARARKQLLTQQSAQMVQYEQTLTDFGTALDREGLARFVGQQSLTAMSEVRSELERHSQTAPGKRGDISAKLEIFSTRIRDIDSAIGSARSVKTQAEQTRRTLVENEGAARHVLDAAASEELKGAFDEEFRNSTNELINRFRDLESSDLWVISKRQEEIDDARRKLGGLQNAIGSARSVKTQAEQTRRTLVENEGAARHVLDAAASEELKGAFDEEFRNSTNELINRFRDLESSDLWVISKKQEEIDDARRKLGGLQNQISDAGARYDRAKRLDGMRQTTMQKIGGALSELAQPEIRGKLGNDGLAVIASLRNFQDTLLAFDSVRLINRPDYGETLVATNDDLAKAQQFKAEIVQVTQLVNDLREFTNRIDRRGRRLLDGPTSSTVAEIGKSVSALNAAKIPLSSEPRVQLSNIRVALNRVQDVVDEVMDREETRVLMRGLPSRSGVWRFSVDKDKITDEERVQALAHIESSQAKYELTVTCGKRGGELVVTTFDPLGTDAKRIPWSFYDSKPDRRIRLRIDSNPALGASLEMRGYVNQGQVRLADMNALFENLVHSSRLVLADVFPDEQVEVATAYPAQFSRLCELVAPRRSR